MSDLNIIHRPDLDGVIAVEMPVTHPEDSKHKKLALPIPGTFGRYLLEGGLVVQDTTNEIGERAVLPAYMDPFMLRKIPNDSYNDRFERSAAALVGIHDHSGYSTQLAQYPKVFDQQALEELQKIKEQGGDSSRLDSVLKHFRPPPSHFLVSGFDPFPCARFRTDVIFDPITEAAIAVKKGFLYFDGTSTIGHEGDTFASGSGMEFAVDPAYELVYHSPAKGELEGHINIVERVRHLIPGVMISPHGHLWNVTENSLRFIGSTSQYHSSEFDKLQPVREQFRALQRYTRAVSAIGESVSIPLKAQVPLVPAGIDSSLYDALLPAA